MNRVSGRAARALSVVTEPLEGRTLFSGAAAADEPLIGRRADVGTLSGIGATASVYVRLATRGRIDAAMHDSPGVVLVGLYAANDPQKLVQAPAGSKRITLSTPPGLDPSVPYELRLKRVADTRERYTVHVAADYAGETFASAYDGGSLVAPKSITEALPTIPGVREDNTDLFRFAVPVAGAVTATVPHPAGAGNGTYITLFQDKNRDGTPEPIGRVAAPNTNTASVVAGTPVYVRVGWGSGYGQGRATYTLNAAMTPTVPNVAASLVGYRPQSAGFDYTKHKVAADLGVGVRINGDDDNRNGRPDREDRGLVAGEDDLIRLDVTARGDPLPAGWTYAIRRSTAALKVWTGPRKDTAVLDGAAVAAVRPPQPGGTSAWWVEWAGAAHGTGTLTLELRNPSGQTVKTLGRAEFYTFRSRVVVLGGWRATPVDPLPPNDLGTYKIGARLYDRGYDVHMYDQYEVGWPDATRGLAYPAVTRAVRRHGVQNVAIFGHSWGGGATYNLADAISQNRSSIGTFSIRFTGYIDAILRPTPWTVRENRLPPGTAFHLNFWQDRYGASNITSGHVSGPATRVKNVFVHTPTVSHTAIDEEPIVQTGPSNMATVLTAKMPTR